jgi:hypothetical protein
MSEIRREPIEGATVWRARDIASEADWLYRLSDADRREVDGALAHAKATGKPLDDISRDDFPLPGLTQQIERWLSELCRGKGFINIKGLPVAGRDAAETRMIYWGLGTHLGVAVSQNAAGDRLSHVCDFGVNPGDRSQRLYKTSIALGFHSDGSDIAGLLCLREAKWGGVNRLASCGAIYNEFLARRPDLVPVLYEPFAWDRNGEEPEGQPAFFSLPICSNPGGQLRFFYIGWYIRNAQRHAAAPRMSAEQHQAIDLIDEIAQDPEVHFSFRLEPGELSLLKNSAALHARTSFEDHDDPEQRRHLLRLWLTAHGDWADADAFVQQGIPAKPGAVSDAVGLASRGT